MWECYTIADGDRALNGGRRRAGLFAADDFAVRLAGRDLLVDDLDLRRQPLGIEPVLYRLGKLDRCLGPVSLLDDEIVELSAGLDRVADRLAQLGEVVDLAGQDLFAAGGTVTRQYRRHVKALGFGNDARPIRGITIAQVVVRSIGDGIAGAEDFLVRQVDEPVAARVRPSEEMELDFPRPIVEDKLVAGEGLSRRLRGVEIELGDVLPRFGGVLP